MSRDIEISFGFHLSRPLYSASDLSTEFIDFSLTMWRGTDRETIATLVSEELPEQASPTRSIKIRRGRVLRVTTTATIPMGEWNAQPEGEVAHLSNEVREAILIATREVQVRVLEAANRFITMCRLHFAIPLALFAAIDIRDLKILDKVSRKDLLPGLSTLSVDWTLVPDNEILRAGQAATLEERLDTLPSETFVDTLFLEAKASFDNNELRKAVIDCAICCEVATRESFSFRYETVEGQEVSVSELCSRIAYAVSGTGFHIIDSVGFDWIRHLFWARNKAVHEASLSYVDDEGRAHVIDRASLGAMLRAARSLLSWLKSGRPAKSA